MKMRWGSGGGRLHRDLFCDLEVIRDKILENDATWCPLNSWSEVPKPGDYRKMARKSLMEILGIDKFSSDLFFEISPMNTGRSAPCP